MRALSDNYTPTVVITPEQMRETVAQHWRASSFLLQICNISTAHGWRKSKNLASHGSLLQRLKYLVPATIELNPPHPQLQPQLHPLLNLPIQACMLTLTDGAEACECFNRRTNTNHFGRVKPCLQKDWEFALIWECGASRIRCRYGHRSALSC